MIVLTSNDESTYKPQSSLYRLLPHYGITLPLTRAIICHCLAQNDTSGAFFIKAPLSFLLFTLHQIGWNPDKHWGCERWRVAHHSSPLFTRINHLDTNTYTISVKSEECFWKWLTITADLKSGVNHYSTTTYNIFTKESWEKACIRLKKTVVY